MNYFIIHSGSDYEHVELLVKKWGAGLERFRTSVLKGTQDDWHDDAHAKIRSAEKIIYIIGETSSASENIDWELNVAIEEKKEIYVYKLDEKYALNNILSNKGNEIKQKQGDVTGEIVFSNSKHKISLLNEENLCGKLKEDDEYIAEKLETSSPKNMEIAMKQYEMFVETSEELVRRKQNVNSFYISLNSLILGAISAVFVLGDQVQVLGTAVSLSTALVCLFTLVGGIICFSWHSVLQSYADLNSSKMKIIAYIESQLAYNLYDTEWQLVSKKMGNKKYKSFSKKEMFIAKLFVALYILLFVVSLAFEIIHF